MQKAIPTRFYLFGSYLHVIYKLLYRLSTRCWSSKQQLPSTGSRTFCRSSTVQSSETAAHTEKLPTVQAARVLAPPTSLHSQGVIHPHDNKASPFHELDLMEVWEGVSQRDDMVANATSVEACIALIEQSSGSFIPDVLHTCA